MDVVKEVTDERRSARARLGLTACGTDFAARDQSGLRIVCGSPTNKSRGNCHYEQRTPRLQFHREICGLSCYVLK